MQNETKLAVIEVEEAILGGILLDSNSMPKVADKLKSEAFFVIAHKHIYRAMEALYLRGENSTLLEVSTWLADNHCLEAAGGIGKLSQLLNRTVSAANLDKYAELVIGKHTRRELGRAGNSISELAYDTTLELGEVMQRSSDLIFNLSCAQSQRQTLEHISGCARTVFYENEEGIDPGYSTGLEDLDELINGLTRRHLTVVAARAAMGKTWFACHLIEHIAKTTGKTALFFSAEMSRYEITKRIISMHSGIDSKYLNRNFVPPEQLNEYIDAIDSVSALPIMLDDTIASNLTISQIRSTIRQVLAQNGEISIIVLDYLQALGNQTAVNRANEVGKYAVACKGLATEFGVPFVALAQVNRGVENQSDKRPGMADIRDSGMIEQSADVVLTLYRDEYYNPGSPDKGTLEIKVAKNRGNGGTGAAKVFFDPRIGKFNNLKSYGS